MRLIAILLLLVLVVQTSLTHAGNWAHWRGPTGNSDAVDAKPPTEFSSEKNVKWKVAVPGRGSASPIIWGNQVFISTAVPTKGAGSSDTPTCEFKLLCFDRSNGKLIWEQTATVTRPPEAGHPTNSFASASPCTDGEHVYAHFGSQGLYCYTLDGKFVWKRDDFGPMETLNHFGEGSSPTIAGDKIIVPWDNLGPSALYALDKKTGKTIWKQDRERFTCWATPLIVEYGGRKQVVMNGQSVARGYDLETGNELWHCAGQTRRPIASPVAANGTIYVGSGFQGAFIGAFVPDGLGDLKGTDKVKWTITQDAPDVASPALSSSGRMYFHKGKSGQLSCVDAATGKPHYMAKRIPEVDSTYGSPVTAGGFVYLSGRSGKIVVIKDADDLEIVSTNDMQETLDATPAPVDNELFVRGEKHLFCIANAK